jgi:hypothetical protein
MRSNITNAADPTWQPKRPPANRCQPSNSLHHNPQAQSTPVKVHNPHAQFPCTPTASSRPTTQPTPKERVIHTQANYMLYSYPTAWPEAV